MEKTWKRKTVSPDDSLTFGRANIVRLSGVRGVRLCDEGTHPIYLPSVSTRRCAGALCVCGGALGNGCEEAAAFLRFRARFFRARVCHRRGSRTHGASQTSILGRASSSPSALKLYFLHVVVNSCVSYFFLSAPPLSPRFILAHRTDALHASEVNSSPTCVLSTTPHRAAPTDVLAYSPPTLRGRTNDKIKKTSKNKNQTTQKKTNTVRVITMMMASVVVTSLVAHPARAATASPSSSSSSSRITRRQYHRLKHPSGVSSTATTSSTRTTSALLSFPTRRTLRSTRRRSATIIVLANHGDDDGGGGVQEEGVGGGEEEENMHRTDGAAAGGGNGADGADGGVDYEAYLDNPLFNDDFRKSFLEVR